MDEPTLEDVVKPVIEWLATHHHPHTKIIIDSISAELVEGVEMFVVNDDDDLEQS